MLDIYFIHSYFPITFLTWLLFCCLPWLGQPLEHMQTSKKRWIGNGGFLSFNSSDKKSHVTNNFIPHGPDNMVLFVFWMPLLHSIVILFSRMHFLFQYLKIYLKFPPKSSACFFWVIFAIGMGTYMVILGCVCMLSHVRLFATKWPIAHQALLSMGFSRQEYWRGLPFFLLQGIFLHW